MLKLPREKIPRRTSKILMRLEVLVAKVTQVETMEDQMNHQLQVILVVTVAMNLLHHLIAAKAKMLQTAPIILYPLTSMRQISQKEVKKTLCG